MSLCKYLPTPSDRMGIIWTLLSIKGAVVLEYGPAGTTHFSVGLYGSMGVAPNQSLFTTHLSEDDIVMGDVTRLEEAIKEIDTNYKPEVIFVVASAVTSIIGTDIKGVCNYMKEEVKATLIPVDTGGFKGDYTLGMREGYQLLVKTIACGSVEKKEKSYNILGATGYSYRMKSDLWEINSLMERAFSYQHNATLGLDSSIAQIRNLGAASVNLVLRAEALPTAKILKEKYGTPYLYALPYGYAGTKEWLEKIAEVIGEKIAPELLEEIRIRMLESVGYRMYASMYAGKEIAPAAIVIGDYDQIRGLSKLFEEIALPVELKIVNHSMTGLDQEDIIYVAKERDKIALLKDRKRRLVFGDDISLHMCDESCEKFLSAFPLINHRQIATHIPLMGIHGMDYILETVDCYLGKL